MGSCDPESVRRCLPQPPLPDSLKSCGETNFTDSQATFTQSISFACLLTSYEASSSGILQELMTPSLESFMSPPLVSQNYSEGLLSLAKSAHFTFC